MPADNAKRVKPRLLKGFNDRLPAEALARRDAIARIEALFLLYGFSPVETPILEHLDVLLGPGGEGADKEIFRLLSPEEEDVGMRFDLTVPFSRVAAQYPDAIKAPFRRYAIGPVFRADKPGPGRFRQFTQLDADIAGAPNILADAELASLMCAILTELGAERFEVRINNRKIIDALLQGLGIAEAAKQKHVLRVIDKLAKVGLDNIRLELGPGRIDDSGDPIPGVGLPDAVIAALLDFIALRAASRAETVALMQGALPQGPAADAACAEMAEMAEALEALEVAETHAVFDPSLARGLDYYTGPVFEAVFPEAPAYGSVMAGGRYDGLVSRFTSQAMPCTGMSVGLDRLLAALEGTGALPPPPASVQALVVTLGKIPAAAVMGVAQELRAAGIRTDIFYGSKKKMKMGTQLSHADHYGIPVAVILGEDETAAGMVSVKDLVAGKALREDIEDRDAYREAGKTGQQTVPRANMVAAVQALLEAREQ